MQSVTKSGRRATALGVIVASAAFAVSCSSVQGFPKASELDVRTLGCRGVLRLAADSRRSEDEKSGHRHEGMRIGDAVRRRPLRSRSHAQTGWSSTVITDVVVATRALFADVAGPVLTRYGMITGFSTTRRRTRARERFESTTRRV